MRRLLKAKMSPPGQLVQFQGWQKNPFFCWRLYYTFCSPSIMIGWLCVNCFLFLFFPLIGWTFLFSISIHELESMQCHLFLYYISILQPDKNMTLTCKNILIYFSPTSWIIWSLICRFIRSVKIAICLILRGIRALLSLLLIFVIGWECFWLIN